ncbi:MAG: hypothetical protein D6773_13335, partial [Alphaproteobacteria bacterium]
MCRSAPALLVALFVAALSGAAAAEPVLTAPATTYRFDLGPQDPPAELMLSGWFCPDPDDGPLDAAKRADKLISDALARAQNPDLILRYQLIQRYFDGWGGSAQARRNTVDKLAEDLGGKRLSGLDAPWGGHVRYIRPHCYTRASLTSYVNAVSRRVAAELRSTWARFVDEGDRVWYLDAFTRRRFGLRPPPNIAAANPVAPHRIVIDVTRKARRLAGPSLPQGHRLVLEANRGAQRPSDKGLLALPKGRDVTASAARGIDEEINLGGEGGLLALPKGRDVT